MPSHAYEKALYRKNFNHVAGVDEVGRGPLAGPIVAAAVILPPDCKIKGLDDSKKISPRRREILFIQIIKQAVAVGLGKVNHALIDRINIGRANLLAMKMAVEKLKLKPDYLLVDGARNRLDVSIPQRAINRGDAKCSSIAAASIVAKVTRDRLMKKYHVKYPFYGFDRHKGYGTALHLKQLSQYGPCPIHRRSFLPVRQAGSPVSALAEAA